MKEIVPASIEVRAEGSMLWFSNIEPGDETMGSSARLGSSGSYACQNPEVDVPEHWLIAACWHAFDDLQDFIDESTTEPWPGTGGNVPRLGVYLEGNEVLIWFGDAAAPVLRVRPVLTDDVL